MSPLPQSLQAFHQGEERDPHLSHPTKFGLIEGFYLYPPHLRVLRNENLIVDHLLDIHFRLLGKLELITIRETPRLRAPSHEDLIVDYLL